MVTLKGVEFGPNQASFGLVDLRPASHHVGNRPFRFAVYGLVPGSLGLSDLPLALGVTGAKSALLKVKLLDLLLETVKAGFCLRISAPGLTQLTSQALLGCYFRKTEIVKTSSR
jgi:hypothetical protein